MTRLRSFVTRLHGRAFGPARTDKKDAGSALVLVLCVMILLGMTSMVFIRSASNSVVVAKSGRDVTQARQAANVAAADAIQQMNSASLAEAAFPTAASPRSIADSAVKGTWTWWATKSAVAGSTTIPERLYVTGASKTVGAVGTTQKLDFPLRSTTVGSYQPGTGTNPVQVYGTSGQGAFKNALSMTEDSTVAAGSIVTGNVGIFGNGELTANGTVAKAVTYSDNAANIGAKVARSALSARLDKNLLDGKVAACAGNWLAAPVASYAARPALYCLNAASTDFPVNMGSSGTGVATLVTTGDINFLGNVAAGATSQIHVYSATTGNVNLNASAVNSYVHVFAPNAHCRVIGGTVKVFGSLSCKNLTLSGTFSNVAPYADNATTPGASAKKIYYLESADYTDSLNP